VLGSIVRAGTAEGRACSERSSREPFSPLSSVALGLALVAVVISVGGAAWGDSGPRATSTAVGNLKVVKSTFTISNGEVAGGEAKCTSGTKVFSGGYASSGQHAKIFVSAPARGSNSYVVKAVTPPVNINAGVTKETTTITVEAYCAPAGRALVL
jgi:hypothetical protein